MWYKCDIIWLQKGLNIKTSVESLKICLHRIYFTYSLFQYFGRDFMKLIMSNIAQVSDEAHGPLVMVFEYTITLYRIILEMVNQKFSKPFWFYYQYVHESISWLQGVPYAPAKNFFIFGLLTSQMELTVEQQEGHSSLIDAPRHCVTELSYRPAVQQPFRIPKYFSHQDIPDIPKFCTFR